MRLAILAILMPLQAQSNAHCGHGPSIEQRLIDGYGETIAGTGIAPNGSTFTALYVNPETGTWTILTIFPDGTACIRGVGESWQRFEHPPVGEEG